MMNWLGRILGFDQKRLWFYRDLILGMVATISTLWAIVALFFTEHDAFDRHLGIVCTIIAIICCTISPNRLTLFIMVVGIVAAQGLFALAVTHDARGWWVAVPALLVEGALLRFFGKHTIHR